MREETKQLIHKAKRALNASKLLFKNGDYDFAASRAYYAMFYVAEAALLEDGKTYSKHAGVINGFYHQFIATKLLDRKFHQAFHRAFEDRSEGDYAFLDPFPKQDAKERLKDAEAFLQAVETLIK